MPHYIITKWIEPYVLLETAKKSFEMQDFTFDGFNKEIVKKNFLKTIDKSDAFGLYMKNVNKFYLFHSHHPINIPEFLTGQMELSNSDYYETEDNEEPFRLVDIGKAETAIFS